MRKEYVLYLSHRLICNLSNSEKEKVETIILVLQIILNSMHKYQPRFHVILDESEKGNSRTSLHEMNKDHLRTFIFPETQFMAVTAYQNHMVCIVQFTSSFVVRNKKLKHATLVSQGWKPEVSFFLNVCLPNLYCSSHYQIYIVKCLYTRRDD